MNLVQAEFSHSAFRRGGDVPDQVGKQRVPADVVNHPAQGPARSAAANANNAGTLKCILKLEATLSQYTDTAGSGLFWQKIRQFPEGNRGFHPEYSYITGGNAVHDSVTANQRHAGNREDEHGE